MPHVILIEDDAKLTQMLCRGLGEERFLVEPLRDGPSGLQRLLGGAFDLCILDVLLPGLSGFEVLAQARAQGVCCPILMLTACGDIPQRVQGLEGGADDYLTKPFAFAELLARLHALLRRGQLAQVRLRLGDLELCTRSQQLLRGGQPVTLSPKQFALLELLLRNRGQVVSRTMILKRLWGYDFDPGTNLIDVHIAHLRQKIDAPAQPSLIQSVRGVGYRIPEDPGD